MNGDRKRQYERMPFLADLIIVDQATRVRYTGRSIDLSRAGMGFYADRFFETGTRMTILAEIGRAEDNRPELIAATVRWARVEGDGAIMGVEFDVPLEPAVHPQWCERLYGAGSF